ISVDFLKKKTEIVRLKNLAGDPGPLDVTIDLPNGKGTKLIYFDQPKVDDTNAIKMELELFIQSVLHNTSTSISVEDGYHALHVAHQVMEKLNSSLNVLA